MKFLKDLKILVIFGMLLVASFFEATAGGSGSGSGVVFGATGGANRPGGYGSPGQVHAPETVLSTSLRPGHAISSTAYSSRSRTRVMTVRKTGAYTKKRLRFVRYHRRK